MTISLDLSEARLALNKVKREQRRDPESTPRSDPSGRRTGTASTTIASAPIRRAGITSEMKGLLVDRTSWK